MSKGKTVLKFAIAAVLLGGSSTVAVLYFPYVALAIKFGMVVSIAPMAIFAISAIVVLVSAITLTVFTVSAIRNKGKSSEVGEESISEEKEQSLVQAAPSPAAPLLSQEPEKLVIPVPQQQPVGGSVEGIEALQPEESNNVVVSGDDAGQQTSPTSTDAVNGSLPSLPPYPEPTSPMNSIGSLPFPNPPSGEHNSSRNARNLLPNPFRQTRVKVVYSDTGEQLPLPPSASPLNSLNQSQPLPNPPPIVVDGDNGSGDSSSPVQNHEVQTSIPIAEKLKIAVSAFESGREAGRLETQLDQADSEEEMQEGYNSVMMDSYVSWGTDWDDDSMMSLSLHQHTLSFGIPLITEEEEGANTHLQEPRVNQRVQLEQNYPGFYRSADGKVSYGLDY